MHSPLTKPPSWRPTATTCTGARWRSTRPLRPSRRCRAAAAPSSTSAATAGPSALRRASTIRSGSSSDSSWRNAAFPGCFQGPRRRPRRAAAPGRARPGPGCFGAAPRGAAAGQLRDGGPGGLHLPRHMRALPKAARVLTGPGSLIVDQRCRWMCARAFWTLRRLSRAPAHGPRQPRRRRARAPVLLSSLWTITCAR